MRFVRGKESDVRDISVCRRKSLEKVNLGTYSKEGVEELVEVHLEEFVKKDLKDYDVFCLKRRGILVATAHINGNRIEGLYVHPLFVGKGYGEKMLRYVEKKIRKSGYKTVTVFSSLASESFFRNRGYVSTDVALTLTKHCMKFVFMGKVL